MLSFTKEELEFILDNLENEISTYRMANTPAMNRFREKIKYMIEREERQEKMQNWFKELKVTKCYE
jgi:hypothetical protein